MISIAVHVIFAWILGVTMQAQIVKELPAPKPEIREEMKPKEMAPTIPVQPELPAAPIKVL